MLERFVYILLKMLFFGVFKLENYFGINCIDWLLYSFWLLNVECIKKGNKKLGYVDIFGEIFMELIFCNILWI